MLTVGQYLFRVFCGELRSCSALYQVAFGALAAEHPLMLSLVEWPTSQA